MKLRPILSLCLAGMAISGFAQSQLDGVQYYKADQLENAKELLTRNMNQPGGNKAESDFYLGLIALKENNATEAARLFNEGAQADPDYGYNYVGLAAIELKNGNAKVAEGLFKDAASKAKKDPSLQVAIARAYYEVDPVKYDKEITKALEKARKINMEEADIYIFEGDRLFDKKDWGGAAAKYEMGANYEQSAAEAYVKYANLFTQVNQQYAIDMLSKLLSLNPDSALAQRELANAYYNNKNYAEAAKAYGQYVKNPNHFKQDEDRYAFLLFYGGDYQAGYDYASKLLAQNPSNFTAQRFQFMNAAQIPAMAEQLLPMAEKLLAAHKSNPDNKFAPIDYTLIAEEFQNAKRPDEAIEVLQEAIKEAPANASFNKQLAMVFVDQGNIPAAAEAYEGYLSKTEDPNFNDFSQQATFSYYAGVDKKESDPAASAKYFDDALKYAAKAQEKMPENYKPKKIEGDVAIQRAAKADATKAGVAAYEQAAQLLEKAENPQRYASDAKNIYNYLGNYYLDKGDKATAKTYFNKYLQFDPDNADYRKFVEGL